MLLLRTLRIVTEYHRVFHLLGYVFQNKIYSRTDIRRRVSLATHDRRKSRCWSNFTFNSMLTRNCSERWSKAKREGGGDWEIVEVGQKRAVAWGKGEMEPEFDSAAHGWLWSKRGQLWVTRKQEGGETTVHHDGRGKGGGSDDRGVWKRRGSKRNRYRGYGGTVSLASAANLQVSCGVCVAPNRGDFAILERVWSKGREVFCLWISFVAKIVTRIRASFPCSCACVPVYVYVCICGIVLATSSLVCRSENLGDEDPQWSGVVASSSLSSSLSRFEASQEGITIVDCWDGGSFLSAKGLTRPDWLIGREDNRKELVDASRRPRVPGGGCPPVRTGEYTFTRLETTRGEEADKCTVSLRFSLFCGLRFYSFDRKPNTHQSCKCDPYAWSALQQCDCSQPFAYVFPRFSSASETKLFETIVLWCKYKQKDEI